MVLQDLTEKSAVSLHSFESFLPEGFEGCVGGSKDSQVVVLAVKCTCYSCLLHEGGKN